MRGYTIAICLLYLSIGILADVYFKEQFNGKSFEVKFLISNKSNLFSFIKMVKVIKNAG